MRAGASSGAWIGAALAFLAFAIGFLWSVLPIPADVTQGLTIVCFLLMGIAFYGAYKAHYQTAPVSEELVAEVPELSTADARVCWVMEKSGGYVESDSTAPSGEIPALRAIVVAFRNESSRPSVAVRAEVHYVQMTEMERTACATWLGETQCTAVIAPRESKDLLVALYDGASFLSVTDNRQSPATTGCTRRALPFRSFTAWIKLSLIDSSGRLIGEFDERVGVAVRAGKPTVEIIGPPGAIRGLAPHTIADVSVICDEWSVVVEVTNHGEAAIFSATLGIRGPVKSFRTTDIYCQWAHTSSVEARITKGQTCRFRVADRLRDTGAAMLMGFSWWSIHAIVDGYPFDIESAYHSTPFSEPPAVAGDIEVELEVIANPDLIGGVEQHRITLHAFKAASTSTDLPLLQPSAST